MCVSFAPAEFFGAIAMATEVGDGTHLLGYENSAQNRNSRGANCMVLHVPTAGLTAESLVDTQHATRFMENMGDAVRTLKPQMRGGSRGFDPMLASFGGPVVVEYGAYEIVLSSSATEIPDALELVSQEKRPFINEQLMEWYDNSFPGYSFILACFNNSVQQANHPILVRYTPSEPGRLFVPGLESHTGRPPSLMERDHPRDFKVVFGSRVREPKDSDKYFGVRYSDNLGALKELLPETVVGFRDENYGSNFDYWASVEDVRNDVNNQELFQTMPEHFSGSPLDWSRR